MILKSLVVATQKACTVTEKQCKLITADVASIASYLYNVINHDLLTYNQTKVSYRYALNYNPVTLESRHFVLVPRGWLFSKK